MTDQPGLHAAADRRRAARPIAFVAIVALAAIAIVTVLAFQSLNLLRASAGTNADTGSGEVGVSESLATPRPTPIMPSLFALPDRWLAGKS